MSNKPVTHNVFPLLKLAIPLVLTGIMQSAVYFFETIFLAHLGPFSLAAGSLVSWLFSTLVVILFGALSSVNILISLKHGAKDKHSISLILRDGFILTILLTIPTVLLAWNIAPIFLWFGQKQMVVELATPYLHALAWGILPNLLVMTIFEFLMGIGHARVIMMFTILEVSSSIIASYAFIFGKFGFPPLDIAGAGWGVTTGYCLTLLILILYVLCKKEYRDYFKHVLSLLRPFFLVELLQIGIPMGIMYSFEVGFFFALTLMMGYISSESLAANQIVMQYLGVLMSVIFSIAQAVTVRMGHLLGAKEIDLAAKASDIGVYISTVFMGIAAIFYWFFPSLLISVDFDIANPANKDILVMTESIFASAAFFQIFEAIRITLFGSLRALKDTRFTLLTSVVSFWGISLPLGYFFAMHFHLGGNGLWLGMTLGAIMSAAILQYRFKKKMARVKLSRAF